MLTEQVFTRDKDDFQKFSKELLTSWYLNGTFHDVTLASQDGLQIPAHRVVLSSSSSLLNTILRDNKQPSPVIVCRGVEFQEIKCMLEFIYLGRTSLKSGNLQRFLTVSQDFGLQGLREGDLDTGTTQQQEDLNTELIPGQDDKDMEQKLIAAIRNDNNLIQESKHLDVPIKTEETIKLEHAEIRSDDTDQVTYEDSDTKENEEIVIKEEAFYSHINERTYDPKLSRLGRLKLHNGCYQCDRCDYKSTQKKQMIIHKIVFHVKIKFECDVCENIFSDPRSLKKHKTSSHQGVQYECEECGRLTSTAYSLASHKRRKH